MIREAPVAGANVLGARAPADLTRTSRTEAAAGAVPTAPFTPRFLSRYAQWRSPPALSSRPAEYALEVSPLARQAATRSAHCCSLLALLMPAILRTGDHGG